MKKIIHKWLPLVLVLAFGLWRVVSQGRQLAAWRRTQVAIVGRMKAIDERLSKVEPSLAAHTGKVSRASGRLVSSEVGYVYVRGQGGRNHDGEWLWWDAEGNEYRRGRCVPLGYVVGCSQRGAAVATPDGRRVFVGVGAADLDKDQSGSKGGEGPGSGVGIFRGESG